MGSEISDSISDENCCETAFYESTNWINYSWD